MDGDVEHFVGIAGFYARKVGLVAIVIDDLDGLHDVSRQVLCGCLYVPGKIVLAVHAHFRHQFSLRCHVTIHVDRYARELFQQLFHRRAIPHLVGACPVFNGVFFYHDRRCAINGYFFQHVGLKGKFDRIELNGLGAVVHYIFFGDSLVAYAIHRDLKIF